MFNVAYEHGKRLKYNMTNMSALRGLSAVPQERWGDNGIVW